MRTPRCRRATVKAPGHGELAHWQAKHRVLTNFQNDAAQHRQSALLKSPPKRLSAPRVEPAIDKCARTSSKVAPPTWAVRRNSFPLGANRWHTPAAVLANKTGTTSSRRQMVTAEGARPALRPARAFRRGVGGGCACSPSELRGCVEPLIDDARACLEYARASTLKSGASKSPARSNARTRATGAGPVHRRRPRRKTPETTRN
jgi:hypothetical protein